MYFFLAFQLLTAMELPSISQTHDTSLEKDAPEMCYTNDVMSES